MFKKLTCGQLGDRVFLERFSEDLADLFVRKLRDNAVVMTRRDFEDCVLTIRTAQDDMRRKR